MLNSLLIHNDNTPTKELIKKNLKFGLESFGTAIIGDSSDIDQYISTKFIYELNEIDFDVLYIKDSLTSNYIDFYGLVLAYHIRLSEELGDKRFVPIVILSDLDGYAINKITDLGNILFTKNIFIAKNNIKSVGYFENKLKDRISIKDSFNEDFLNLIDVKPPQDYLSHHSIANEWSMYRWAEYLKVSSKDVEDVKDKISSMLYFKYLKYKYPVPKSREIKFNVKVIESGRILYIDDEWEKGWKSVFQDFFSIADTIEFKCIEEDYRDQSSEDILLFVIKNIVDFDPDMILLDLRLCDTDFEKVSYKEITGIKILNEIKKINPGIQKIVFTASQDSLIIEEAFHAGALGYVKKEHPDNYTLTTKNNIKKLSSLVEEGLSKRYLKDIWNILKEILKLNISDEISIEATSVFEILNSNLEHKYRYAMFSIYKILEIIKDKYIIDRNNEFKGNKNAIKCIQQKNKNGPYIPIPKVNLNLRDREIKKYYYSTSNRIKSVLYELLEIKDKDILEQIDYISKKRNCTIHLNSSRECQSLPDLDSDIIKRWFIMIKIILLKETEYSDERH